MGSGSFLDLTGGSNTNLTQTLTFGPTPINVPLSGTASSNMTITGSGAAAGFGTFETTSVEVIARTTGFLDLYFLGTYNPDFGPSGGGTYAQDEAASFRLNVTRNSSVDGSTSTDFVGVLVHQSSAISGICQVVAVAGTGFVNAEKFLWVARGLGKQKLERELGTLKKRNRRRNSETKLETGNWGRRTITRWSKGKRVGGIKKRTEGL